jgi:hypothetical protein
VRVRDSGELVLMVGTGLISIVCGSCGGNASSPRSDICCWLRILAAETPAINTRDGFRAQAQGANERFVDDGVAGFAVFLGLNLDYDLLVEDVFPVLAQHHRTTRRPQHNPERPLTPSPLQRISAARRRRRTRRRI